MVDAASPRHVEQVEQVNAVLAEIGAEDIPQLIVWNKIDLVPDWSAGVERDEYGKLRAVKLSALDGIGAEHLRAALLELALSSDAKTTQPSTSDLATAPLEQMSGI